MNIVVESSKAHIANKAKAELSNNVSVDNSVHNWSVRKLTEVVDILDSKRKPINSAERENRIHGKDIDLLFPYYGATGQVGYIDDYLIDGEFVLLGEDGAPFLDPYKAKAYIITGKSWVNNHAHILCGKAGVLDNKFLCYYLNSISYKNYVNGTTRLKLNQSNLKEMPVVVPSLLVQKNIVQKIEELFSELDHAEEQLSIAKKQIQSYMLSVLQHAFEGYYTNGNTAWEWVRLNDIGKWSGGGTPSKANTSYWEDGNIPWVSPKDMKAKDIYETIDLINGQAISNSSAKLIGKNSLLFVVRSGILRRTLPVSINRVDLTVNQDLQAFTPTINVNIDFLYWYFKAYNDKVLRDCSKSGTTVESIETLLLRQYKVPLPTLRVQNSIVKEVEQRVSQSDNMLKYVNDSLPRIHQLRQSILHKAFTGQLK